MSAAAPADSVAATFKSLAPVLIVEDVGAGVTFWRDRLGFTVENEVPAPNGNFIFASAKRGNVEVMYQSRESVLSEDPSSEKSLNGHSVVLFIDVGDIKSLDAVEQALDGAPVVKPRHETFYGMTEIYVREPGGNVVGFAAR